MDSVADEDIYWEAFFQSVPESVDLFAEGTDVDLSRRISPQESPKGSSNASPISISSWIDDLEQFLLDDDSREAAESHDFCGNFFSDIVPDSRPDGDVPVVGEIPSPEADSEEKEKSGVSDEDGAASKGEIQSPEMISAADEKESNENDSVSEERGRARDEDEDGEEDEQSRKKRKRQLRNRDSAMKSRERKKLYVRDLELKSRFLEGECKRLEYALRCSVAENQILYQRLQNEKGLDASVPKQESAVLLKESLPLGSLFWLISIMFVLLFPGLKLTVAVGRASSRRGDKGQEVVVEMKMDLTMPERWPSKQHDRHLMVGRLVGCLLMRAHASNQINNV
ncbi:hypothetical protein ACLOJK_038830 [Asimina triloba]